MSDDDLDTDALVPSIRKNGATQQSYPIARQLAEAGYVCIRDHGITHVGIFRAHEAAARAFMLPLETRLRYKGLLDGSQCGSEQQVTLAIRLQAAATRRSLYGRSRDMADAERNALAGPITFS